MSVKDFCDLTGYPLQMVRRLCREGELPYLKNGRVYLVNSDVLERILAKRATDHQHVRAWGNSDTQSWKEQLRELGKKKSPEAAGTAMGHAN